MLKHGRVHKYLGARCQAFTKLQAKQPSPGPGTRRMEESNITNVEEPTVGAQQPEYNDDEKKPSTPSDHQYKDYSKEKEAGAFNEVPAYTDVEGQEGEIHLDSAADIVTQVIDLEDDPSLNPWTFRMFFIGTAALPDHSSLSRSPLSNFM
jgi:hypothetical protein